MGGYENGVDLYMCVSGGVWMYASGKGWVFLAFYPLLSGRYLNTGKAIGVELVVRVFEWVLDWG